MVADAPKGPDMEEGGPAPGAPSSPPTSIPADSSSPRPRWDLAGFLGYRRLTQSKYVSHPWAPGIGLLSAVVAFSLVVGWIWSTRYWAFQTAAWDLGVYNQAMYTTFHDHLFFYYTADLPAGINGHLFAAHFAPFLFVLLPFYAIAPTPSGLVVIQAVGLALGAIPVYYLARTHLGSGGWPALFAGLYLLTPLTIGSGWYDFHPEAFLPVTGLTAIYFYEQKRLLPFLGAWLLSLTVIETMAPFFLLLSGVGLFALAWRWRSLRPEARRAELTLNGLAFAAALAWLAVSLKIMYSLSPNGGTFGTGYGGAWTILGASSIFDVYPRALLAPWAVGAALAHDAGLKALYTGLVLGGLAFLPLLGRRRYLLPALAWLGLALLSNHVGYYTVNDQYLDYMIPFLFPAAITGVVWLRAQRLELKFPSIRGTRIAGAILVALVVTTGISSPLLPQPDGSFNAVPHGIPVVTAHDDLLHRVLGMIPDGAPVLTTSFVFPEVSSRVDAYVLPASSLFVDNRTFSGVVAEYVNDSQFVLMDFQVDFTGATLLARTTNLTGFGLQAAAQGAYLYSRGWSGPPSLWVPYEYNVSIPSVNAGNGSVDRSGSSGPVLVHSATTRTGLFWRGPYLEAIPPGEYLIAVSASLDSTEPGAQASFQVLNATIRLTTTMTTVSGGGRDYAFTYTLVPGNPYVIANSTIYWNGTGPADQNVTWEETANWSGPGFLETRGWVLAGGLTEQLSSISIRQITATER